MKKRRYGAVIMLIIVIVLLIGLMVAMFMKKGNNKLLEKKSEENNNNTPQIYQKIDDLNLRFLTMENNQKNMIYSPLSIKYALKMLNDGAEGNTKKQIENVLGNNTLTKYNNIKDVLSLANSVYIKNDYSKYVKEEYKNTVEKKYNAEIQYDEFKNSKNINKWIENKTLGKIKNMLEDDMVQGSKMLLVNALAIDMEWQEKFETDKTHGMDFYTNDNKKIEATTMSKETSSDNVKYYKDNDITSLSIDLKKYDNTQLQFVAIMPDDLQKYIKTVTENDINKIIENSTLASKTKKGLYITIPKFSFDYDLDFKEDLKKLGITDAFNAGKADFSNMTNNPKDLYVSDALHKANIDFTEKGIKAAAVTVFAMKESAAIMDESQPEEISIDHPFMFIIRDKNTGEIWFYGTVFEPNLWDNDKNDYMGR